MHTRGILTALAVLTLALATAACGEDENTGGAGGGGAAAEGGGESRTVGVSLASPTIPLYIGLASGMKAKAEELGMELKFTDADEDPVQQLNDIQDLMAQNIDGLLVSPIDAEAAIPAYEDAQANDIPIMSVARNTDPKVETSFIGASWGKYGRDIAEWTCENAGGKGKIGMVKGPAGASFVEDMGDAYEKYMAEECPGMKIVAQVNAAPLTKDQGLAAAQDILSANPDLKVMFANNDDLAQGVIQAVEERGGNNDVIITGFDGTPKAVESIKAGEMAMTIALKPYQWGVTAVETMHQHLEGEDVPQLVEIDTLLIDDGNVGEITPEDIK